MRATPLALLTCAAAVACGGYDEGTRSDTAGFAVRDSAGVRIVENVDSVWTADTRWRLADEPDLRIGSLDGSVPGTDWGGFVQVQSAGDRTVVFDGQSTSIRVFDRSGDHLGTFDVEGEGPMEIQSIAMATTFGADTVAAWGLFDSRFLRIDIESGERVAIPTPQRGWEDTRGLILNGWLDDGSFLMVEMPRMEEMEMGRHVLDGRFFHFASDGSLIQEFAGLPQIEAWRDGETALGPVSFAATGVTMLAGDEIWHAFPNRGFELSRIDPATGAQVELVRIALPREPVSELMAQGMIDQQRAVMNQIFGGRSSIPAEAQRMVDNMLDGMQFADSLPPFAGFSIGADGTLWVPVTTAEQMEATMSATQEIDFSSIEALADMEVPELAVRHVVLDADRRWLGTLETPLGFQPQEYGADYILGTRDDEFGVPYVERYRIMKPE